MRWRLSLLAACAVAVVLVACAAVQQRRARLAKLLKFSHRKHAAEGIGCEDCHGAVAKSKGRTRGAFIPRKKACAECHEVKQACSLCHVGSDRQVKLTRRDRHLHFSHAAHASRVKGGCKVCHPRARTADHPGVALVPQMATCTNACHANDMRAQRCDKCHEDLQRQRLKPVTVVGHQGNFIKRHGALARDARRCAACHDQTHCAACHGRTSSMPLAIRFPERTQARFIHRGDFLGRHPVAARAQPGTCNKCHGSRHCSSCHQLQGLAPTPRRSSPAARNPHGPTWMTPGAAGFHGRRARRDITSCAACHDRGAVSNCVRCHAVGGLDGSPHPPGFKWRNRRATCRNGAMCRACHTAGAGCP